MKVYLLLLLSALTFLAQAQQDYNRITKHSQRTGEWRTYHDNGKVKSATFYKPYQVVYNKAIAFQLGYSMEDVYKDSVYQSLPIWTEDYEYTANWKLIRIKRCYGHSGCRYYVDSLIYFYGPLKQISLDATRFYRQGRVGELVNIPVSIKNHLEQPLLLNITDSSGTFSFSTGIKEISLHPETQHSLNISFQIERGEYFRTIKLNDSITGIQINIGTFGYDVKSEDLQNGQLLLPKKFIYYRTGEEALLTLIDPNKTDTIITVSLKLEQTMVDLTKIKSGSYILSTNDFSKPEVRQCIIRLKDD